MTEEKKKEVGPLFLVGLGLCDENDASARAIELLRGCRTVFAENYTNLMREGTLRRLEEKIGRKIVQLAREEVENEKIILEACALGPTALLVPGDPMTATTHSSLLASARSRNISTHILHAASIFTSAPGAAGLQIYKMGKTATITYWRKNYEPASFIDPIAENMERGAHTLCLLDIDPKLGPMKPSQALELIEKAQGKNKTAVLSPSTPLFVLWHVGWPDEKIWAGKRSEYPYGQEKKGDEPAGPAVILIPGKMHFAEEESWQSARQ
ncbi:MAG: diphthine synthase [Candidatus Marsarchaeota archaeon]|nr:diphthine synthase [Candidatus Marsarchaeota archaeon]